MNCESEYISMMEEIQKKERLFTKLVDSKNYTKISELASELAKLNEKAAQLKETIQQNDITENDVEKLRSIEPKRKSVQNMLNHEIAQTIKFEKLLADELGKKSPYEMRISDNEWRNDKNSFVPIIKIKKQALPDNISEIRKDNTIIRGVFVNRDTRIQIQFGRNAINEIIAKAIPDKKREVPVEARISCLYHIKELIENAVCFDSQISEYNNKSAKKKSPNTLFMHRMYCILDFNNENYLAKLSIEEFYSTDKEDKFKGTYNRLYSIRDIKITPVMLLSGQAYAGLQNANSDTSSSATTVSIAQLYDIVKTYDPNYYENPNAIGRTEREAEIKHHNTYLQAVEEYKKVLPSLSENKEDYIKELDDIIHTCEKIKEAIESGDIEIDRKVSHNEI